MIGSKIFSSSGVGIGLAVYIPLMLRLPKDIGILAVEILPVSSRITTSIPLAQDLAREIGDIISQQSLGDFVFVGNSYGTFFTRLMLDSTYLNNRISKIVMIDPVAVLLHLPDLAYNFTRRKPVEANEIQLWWAAQTDPGIAFTLGRRFCWREHLVWRDQLETRPTTLIMGGRDCIVNPQAIATYVTKKDSPVDGGEWDESEDFTWTWRDEEKWKKSLDAWKGEGLELVWLDGYDHGQGFMSPKTLPKILEIIEQYCRLDATGEQELDTSQLGESKQEQPTEATSDRRQTVG